MIDAGFLVPLAKLLMSHETQVRKEVVWVLSNVAAGTTRQLQVLLDTGLLKQLIEISYNDCYEIKRECVWAISNAVQTQNLHQVEAFLNIGATELLSSILTTQETKTLLAALQGLESLLSRGNNFFRRPVTTFP